VTLGSISVSCSGAACFSVHLHGVRGFSGTPGYGKSLPALEGNSQRLDAFRRSAAVGIKGAPGDAIPANGMVLALAFGPATRRHQGRQPYRSTSIGIRRGAGRLNWPALSVCAWPPPGWSPSLCGDYLSRCCSGHPPRTLPIFLVSQKLLLHVFIPPYAEPNVRQRESEPGTRRAVRLPTAVLSAPRARALVPLRLD